MKAGGILMVILALLLLGGSGFFGYFAHQNSGAAERLGAKLMPEARFIVNIVEAKARRQTYYSLGLAAPAVVALLGGIIMMRKGKHAAA